MNEKLEALRAFTILTGAGVRVKGPSGRTVAVFGTPSEPLITVGGLSGSVAAGPVAPEKADAAKAVLRKLLPQETEGSDRAEIYPQTGEKAIRYSYEKEKELLYGVRIGNGTLVRSAINDLLGDVLFFDFHNIQTIRIRAIELSSLLSRVAIDGGASGESMLRMNEKFVSMVEKAENVEEVCALLIEIAEAFMDSMFSGKALSRPVRKALQYMSEAFASPLTLEITARQAGLAATYFSAVFKKETGLTFREHLNRIRVEEAKRLLENSDFGIVDIALATGFGEQSYFTRVFRRYTGTSPARYRNRQQ